MANPKGKPGRSAFTAERLARALLLICAVAAIFAVCAITLYLFAKGLPALHEVGVGELLFGTVWKPTAAEPSFGIAYIILSSMCPMMPKRSARPVCCWVCPSAC